MSKKNMKNRYAISLIIFAFIAGLALSRYGLRSEIMETNNAVQTLQNDIQKFLASLNETRAIDNLEITIETVGQVIALNNQGAPRKYIGEEFTGMIKKRMAALELLQPDLNDPNKIEKSEFLLQKGQKILEDIEFNYL